MRICTRFTNMNTAQSTSTQSTTLPETGEATPYEPSLDTMEKSRDANFSQTASDDINNFNQGVNIVMQQAHAPEISNSLPENASVQRKETGASEISSASEGKKPVSMTYSENDMETNNLPENTSVQLQEADASQISSVLEEKKTSFHEWQQEWHGN